MTQENITKRYFKEALKNFKESVYNDKSIEICIESDEESDAFNKYKVVDNYYLFNGTLFTISRMPSGNWYSTRLEVVTTGKDKVKKEILKSIKETKKELKELTKALSSLG